MEQHPISIKKPASNKQPSNFLNDPKNIQKSKKDAPHTPVRSADLSILYWILLILRDIGIKGPLFLRN